MTNVRSDAEVKEYYDGKKFVDWLENHMNRDLRKYLTESQKRRVAGWRSGEANASIYLADVILIRLDLHLTDVPEEFLVDVDGEPILIPA